MKKVLQLKIALLMYSIFSLNIVSAQNTPPLVNAGVDQMILLPSSASLSGSATDDGLVNPLSTTWLFVSGPGMVSFSNASILNSAATFSAPGTYYLRLSAQDGQYTIFDTVRIVVRAQATDRKCNMGNYVAFVGTSGSASEIISVTNLSGVAGIQKRYKWANLEPTQGNYNFSSIQADLNTLSTLGKQLIAMIEVKSFDTLIMPTPNYLSSYVAKHGPSPSGAYGYNIALWDSVVITRWKLLLDTLAKTFDNHPNLEGIATQETSLGSNWNPSMASFGYTTVKYRDAMIDILTGASNSFMQSSIFWYMNYISTAWPFIEYPYLSDVARAVAPLGAIRVGGPDVLPDNNGLKNRTYPLYDTLVGEVPLFCSLQNDSYNHPHADTVSYSTTNWTLQELVDFSRDSLHVNYLMWNYKTWITPVGSYTFNDAKPVIANNPIHNPQTSCANLLLTGVNVLEVAGIRIYPNPSDNQFTIELTDYSVNTKITITSIEGKIVYSNTSIPSKKIILNATSWANGVYIIKVTDNQFIKISKLIKQ